VTHRVVLLILSFLICSFLGTFFVLLAQRLWGRRQMRMEQRLGLGPTQRRDTPLQISPEFDETGGMAGRVNRGFSRFFAQTGIDMTPDTAFLVAAAVGLLLCGTVLLWRDNMLEAAGALAFGFLSVIAYFRYRRAKRLAEIREQLPDVMELLARAVRAGRVWTKRCSWSERRSPSRWVRSSVGWPANWKWACRSMRPCAP
jgi:Flp pilus assembly protein TadB